MQREIQTDVTGLVDCFRALADPTRIALLKLLREQPRAVDELVTALALPQPKVSRHLAYLRRCGLVQAKRAGRHVYYRLSNGETSGGWMRAIVLTLP